MRLERFTVLIACAAFAASATAQSVSGSILIKRKLTKKNVTPDVSVYQRGPAVRLGKDSAEDPIVYELSRVVVYLESQGPIDNSAADAGNAATAPPIQIQQLDRRFSPDLAVIPAGSSVSFPNMDPIFHNIFSFSKAKTFDLGSYDKGQMRTVVFPKPGIVDVYCHLHPNMAATIVVTPNRWYARPDRSGQYRIPDVAPGKYTLVAWHKSAGFFRKEIVVAAGQNAVADFFIPVEADPKSESPAAVVAQSAGAR
jgi:plastocyanin